MQVVSFVDNIMVCKGDKDTTHITDGGFVVMKVSLHGDFIKLGVFWQLENAKLFAKFITTNDNQGLKDTIKEQTKRIMQQQKNIKELGDLCNASNKRAMRLQYDDLKNKSAYPDHDSLLGSFYEEMKKDE